jgi:hypothetical protein
MPAFAGAAEVASMQIGIDSAVAFAGALAGESVAECARVAKVPTVVKGLMPVHIAFAGDPADCWHLVLGMEIGLVERSLQQTEEFELELPGSDQVWLPVEAADLRSRDK